MALIGSFKSNIIKKRGLRPAERPVATAVLSATMLMSLALSISFAQTGNYLVPAKPRATLQAPGTNAAFAVHRNVFGKPCLDIEAMSRAHAVNPSVYDNVVSIYNQCAMRISVQICYLKSDSCIDVDVPGQQRKDAILGIRPQMQFFRYSFKEKF